MLFSFIIPCYGSEKSIPGVIGEIYDVMAQRKEYDFEIIAVNDKSPDNVYSVLKELTKHYDKLTVVDLSKNMGKHSAVMAGMSVSRGEFIVNLDDDGQCPMDRLWELYDACGEEYDIVMAHYPEKKQSAFKNFGSSVNSAVSHWLLDKPKELYFSNFGIVRRYVVDELLKYDNPYPYLEGLILRITRRITTVEMEERERSDGKKGHFTLKKSIDLFMNGFTAFSVKPLRVATLMGFLCSLAGFLYGIYIVVNKLVHPDVPIGYSSMMAVMIFIGGIIMLILGMIGEYVGRIYICINKSPQYVIREVYSSENAKK